MEKNKGLFSFRKHPVGDFPDGEKGRKRKGGRLRRSMGFLMAAALVFNTLPASGLAVSASGREAGLCEHHRSHTADCGYMEAQPCTHEHTEECYKTVTECVHEHTDECYPKTEETEASTGEGNATASDAEDREPENCTHQCSEESGCTTKVLDCHHEHDESCGYKEAQECSYVCEICNGTESEDTENSEDAGTDTVECICEILCTEDSINGDCPVCGVEGADLSACKGKEQGSIPEIDTGEKTEEQEKTGEKVIMAWEWIDPEEYLTDGMLALLGAGRENPAFAEDVTALLPEKIQAEVVIVNAAEDEEETEEDAETVAETEGAEITLTGWECASYPEDGAYEGTYTFTASLPGGFVLAEDAAALKVEVELGGAKVLVETVSASYQEASWNDGVTYTTKTADSCTPVTDSTTEWTDGGWYAVSGTVTISEPITVTGEVHLILTDGCDLTAAKGIVVTTGNSLTIYAQSDGTGTLNATGTTDSDNNASAGIGGSGTTPNSGAITIHGGVINATGGGMAGYYGAAGIGGGRPNSGNGGSSGAITIYGGTVTANSGAGDITGAGVGGGASSNNGNGGAGSNITIYGGSVTAASTGAGTGGAGIGGGGGMTGGGTGNNIQINGGMVRATGSSRGAGIGGGGSGSATSGDGTNITISGGTVTAVGGNYAAGIGGGGGYQNTYGGCTGGTGSVTINGGIVDASSPTDVYYANYKGTPIGNGGNAGDTAATVDKTNAIVFENGAGTVCGDVTFDGSYTLPAGYTLNILAGASLSGSGTLSGGGTFTTENLTADMISVPTDLYYTGKDRTEDITTRLSAEMNKGIEICGQTFTVGGWTLAVEKTGDLTYTATYTNNNDNTKTFTKTITLLKSGTKFEGDVKTYNGDTQTTTFNADDTITVKATPAATGTAPKKAAARLRGGYAAPTVGQMALFVGDVQVCEPVQAEADGTYIMTVPAAEVLLQGNAEQNGNAVTLTAKFVGNDNMADGEGTVKVNITAVAMAEKDGTVIGYFGVSNFEGTNNLFFQNAYANATITLLEDVKPSTNSNAGTTCSTMVNITCTLDLAGHNFTSTDTAIYVLPGGNLTIQDSSTGKTGNVSFIKSDGTLKLYGGTFGKIETAYTLASLLAENCAYYRDSTPILLSELAEQKELDGPVTVQECQHTGVEVKDLGGGKHTLTCPYCGYHYEHTTTLTATASGNAVTLNGGCSTEGCGYQTPLGTASFTFPKVTYGQSGDVTCAWDGPTGYYVQIEVVSGNPLQLDKDADENIAEISLDLAQLFGSTKITAGRHKLKVSFFSDVVVRSNACELNFTIDPAPLTADMVTLGQTDVTYNGTEQKPALSVKQGETTLTEETDYEVSYARGDAATTDFTNAGTVNITVTGKGNYGGTVTNEYAISKADVPVGNLAYTLPADLIYTGQPKTAAVKVNSLTGIGTVTVKYKKDNSGDLLAEAKEPGIYHVYADISAGQNYNAAQIEMGSFIISYMATPTVLYNGGEKKDWYNEDVDISAGSAGYTVSDAVDGDYKSPYHISAQEGTVAKTLYFMDASGHISAGVDVKVNFDLTPPTGEIAVGAKWWQNFLHFISFGNYAAKEYTVTIKAEDKNGSGISKIEYDIVTGSSQYTDADTLKAANLSWTEYNSGSKPTVPVSNSQYVVYARLTDNAGNVTYISTDGILLDNTPPTVGSLSVPEGTKKDVTAGFTFTVSEAADYYYVVLPESSAAPSAEDIIVTCGGTLPEGKTGNAISGTFPKGSGAVSADTPGVTVEAENLSPNTAYTVYVTAVDRAVDITDSAEGTPAGNIADVQKADFTTKKTLPVITKNPAISGTYGQAVGEMTMTDGAATDNNGTAVTGTWAVCDADQGKKPSAGTAEKMTVTFTPDSDSFDSVSVEITPAVGCRNLNAEGVTVSEVAGTYTYTGSEIKPPVAVGTGTPAEGIIISDSGATLTANDFTVSYSNNKDAGTASVTITGKGNYTGSVTKTFTIAKASGREVPDVSGSYTDNGQTYTYTVTPTDGAVYRMGADGAWQDGNVFEGIKPGTRVTFYAMMPEDKNHEEGTPKSITVDFPKLTPAAPALSYKADRTNPADVKVTITPVSGAEYSFDGGKTWTESNEQGRFTTSDTVTLAIRLKGTDTHNPSPVQTVTVNLAKKDREAPPAFSLKVEANGETDYTVTIPATEGCEYSFDGETWTDSNVKTGVSVGETVTGYKRYKETNDYNASSAVSAKETMPKFTVKTPVISPAGGSYTGSVSVTITCGSTDAEIYYTTDGSTPSRSSARYTGAFTVTVPAIVKAVAIKDGLDDSAVATASYTKKDGGGSGGNGGGGNENNGGSGGNDEGQGSGGNGSTNPGNGNTTPQPSVTQPTDTNANPGNGANPGTGTTPVNPGNGNTSRPGAGSGSGTGTPAQGTKQPFIKGADGKTGWDVIRAEEEQAQEGSTINVDMNGSVVVPGDIFDSIKGKDITITFDMGNGILWSVDGKSITTDKAGDIDFSVKSGVKTVPVDIVNNVTGESYSIQISLAHEGEFGFTAVLSIGLGKENAGYTASLYYYNESTGELEFICKDQIAEDGTVSLAFTHASDYVIAIDGEQEEGDGAAEAVQPEGTDGEAGDGTAENSSVPENPGTGQTGAVWWIMIVILLLTAAIGAGVFVAVKKKGEDENGRQ